MAQETCCTGRNARAKVRFSRTISRDILSCRVHALARFGRRVCVVPIGEDRLEANVGFTVPLRIIKQRIACGNAGACSLP